MRPHPSINIKSGVIWSLGQITYGIVMLHMSRTVCVVGLRIMFIISKTSYKDLRTLMTSLAIKKS